MMSDAFFCWDLSLSASESCSFCGPKNYCYKVLGVCIYIRDGIVNCVAGAWRTSLKHLHCPHCPGVWIIFPRSHPASAGEMCPMCMTMVAEFRLPARASSLGNSNVRARGNAAASRTLYKPLADNSPNPHKNPQQCSIHSFGAGP
jgi:hypothetical protein